MRSNLLKYEFEYRIFISLGIVCLVSVVSFTVFSDHIPIMLIIGRMLTLGDETALSAGYLTIAFIMLSASVLRIWAGSILTPKRVMSFRVQTDSFIMHGPFIVIRNPIYFADLAAFIGFAFVLPPSGILMPLLLYLHYIRLIRYEEISLAGTYGNAYKQYQKIVPRLIPRLKSLRYIPHVLREFEVSARGIRHNALYILFVPGFIGASYTHELWVALVVGLPAVIDWAIVHTKIGVDKKKSDPGTQPDGNREADTHPAGRMFEDILYAQCWEDPQTDRRALNISGNDAVFCITSGGCNALAYLLDNPRTVVALDINPHQNYLLNIKIAAFHSLGYDDMLAFLGVTESDNRLAMYEHVRIFLAEKSKLYWDANPEKIQNGIIHCGRYERYMQLLRKMLVSLIGKKVIDRFFMTPERSKREELFARKWKNLRWWVFTRIMLSRTVMSLLFDKAFFKYIDNRFSFGEHFSRKARHALVDLDPAENPFLSYILQGGYPNEHSLPVYLKRENYETIRSRVDRITMVTAVCEEYFATLPDGSISKFNFSNIFEWMSEEEHTSVLKESLRVGSEGALMVYRNLLVHRERPDSLGKEISPHVTKARELLSKDLSFIYDNYIIEELKAEGQRWNTVPFRYRAEGS
jgi:S-adenosylmethionine-diacylglycerol 3-amino-3-carboxypropyl transferase